LRDFRRIAKTITKRIIGVGKRITTNLKQSGRDERENCQNPPKNESGLTTINGKDKNRCENLSRRSNSSGGL